MFTRGNCFEEKDITEKLRNEMTEKSLKHCHRSLMTNNTILDSPALGARKESRREDEVGLEELALMSVHEEVGNDDNESRM